MSLCTLIQLCSACIGIVGSLFFAIGIIRQSIEAMARLSGTYWDHNPEMVTALAAQKSDYLFGGGLIFVAFTLQLGSFFAPTTPWLSETSTSLAPWVALIATVILFGLLRWTSTYLSKHYEKQISKWLEKELATKG